MEYNMADKKTDAPAEVTAEQTPQQEIVELANRSSRCGFTRPNTFV